MTSHMRWMCLLNMCVFVCVWPQRATINVLGVRSHSQIRANWIFLLGETSVRRIVTISIQFQYFGRG